MASKGKRADLKSGGSNMNDTKSNLKDVMSQNNDDNQSQAPLGTAVSQPEMGLIANLKQVEQIPDHASFNDSILRPSNVRDIWGTSKIKNAMLDHMQWYFRPRNSWEPERIDYNALNILTEFQCYNLEFAKNEMALNDNQTAALLDLFWNMLEFDPDEKSTQQQAGGETTSPQNTGRNIKTLATNHSQIQSVEQSQKNTARSQNNNMSNKEQTNQQKNGEENIDDELLSKEESEFKQILEHKFSLFKDQLVAWLDHSFSEARITPEQGRRVAEYAHRTFFKHIRLYDFVLKNTKLSEVKRVQLFIEEPRCGADLSKAMVLQDSTMKTPRVQVDLSGEPSMIQGSQSMMDSKMSGGAKQSYATGGSMNRGGAENNQGASVMMQNETSATDSDMDEVVRQANMDKKSKKIIHRAVKGWDEKIAEKLTKGAGEASNVDLLAKKK